MKLKHLVMLCMAFLALSTGCSNPEKELENEAIYISNAIEHEGIDYLSDIPNNDKRITVISADGTVLAERHYQLLQHYMLLCTRH